MSDIHTLDCPNGEALVIAATRLLDLRIQHRTLVTALESYIQDGEPCDNPGCIDGTAPVCDPTRLACVLRRIVLNPAEVDDLIAAEHIESGIA